MNISLLKQLSEAPGIPGREERIRGLIEKQLKPLADTIETDAMGNLIATIRSTKKNAPRVLLACHMDEIGFYVKHIDDKGFLRLKNAGGFDTRNLFSRRVLVQASDGGDVIGLLTPGGRPLHISKEEDRKKIPEVGEFYVDLCIPADAVKKRVRIGDPVTLMQEFDELGDCVTGKAMDNRVAGFVAIEALKKAKKLAYNVVFVATVQEEVGLRGAGPAAYSQKPDIAIGIDTTLCCDTPGVPEDERVTKQGDGVALTLMDGSVISDRKLIDDFAAVARSHKIPYQLSILPLGGTDTAVMQRAGAGVRAMTFSVPTRYIHTVTETIHKRDLQSAIDLLAAWLSK
jgi:endoglucanase